MSMAGPSILERTGGEVFRPWASLTPTPRSIDTTATAAGAGCGLRFARTATMFAMLATASTASTAATAGMGIFMIIGAIFGLILTVLWILVPFALFGIKPLLRELVTEQRRANELTARIAATPPVVVADPRDPRVDPYVR